MMRGVIRSSLAFRFLVIVVAMTIIVASAFQLRQMSVDVLPEFSPPYVEIQTEALGLSAEEVEQLITVPMEQSLLNGVAWLDVIRSESVPGLSSIRIYFQPGTNLFQARQMVAERLTQAYSLPPVSNPPVMIQPLSSTSRFMIIGLSSKDLSLIELSVLARWTIAPRLLGVPGVSNVAIWGQRERQLQVQLDPQRMRTEGVTLQQVLKTSGNALWVSPLSFIQASTPGTGGFIDTANQRIGIWHVLPIKSPQDLAQVPIEGAPSLVLGDVADVVEEHQLMIGDALVNDSPNLLIVLNKFPNTNILQVTRDVESAIEDLKPGLGGVQVDTQIFRPATFVSDAGNNLARALMIGGLLMLVVLAIFLMNWRLVAISIVSIPLSLFAASLVLYQRGMTLNIMTMTGLLVALVIIIDDVIIDVNNISQRLRERRPEDQNRSIASLVLEAASETRSAVFFATLILALVALPTFFLNGVNAAFFQPLALSYALALFASMLVALTVTPALCVILLADMPLSQRTSPVRTWLTTTYERTLGRAVQSPQLALGVLAVFLVAALALTPLMKVNGLMPAFRESDLVVQVDSAPGTSRAEMDRMVARMSTELRSLPGVQNVGAQVGRAIFGDQVANINSAQILVNLAPTADYDASVAAVRETTSGYAGLSSHVTTYLQQTMDKSLTGTNGDVVVRVFGEDHIKLQAQADAVGKAVQQVSGVVDVQVNKPTVEPTLEIQVDLAKAQKYGIKPGDVRRTAAAMFSGILVGSLFEDQKVFDVVVWSTPQTRQSLTNINELLIDTPNGGHVRLSDVAQVNIKSAPQVIRREGVSPYIDVTFNVSDRSVNAVAADVRSAIRQVPFELEYHAEVLGGYTERSLNLQNLLIAGIVVFLGILLLLQASFRSWRLAILTFITLPAALSGGVAAIYLTQGNVTSLGALLGFLPLLGIAVRNSIMLINRYERMETEVHPFGRDFVLRGVREQTVPVVMTALISALVFAPFVFMGNMAGFEFVRPLAIVILGGLVTTTLLNLFILPALYLRFGEASREADLGLLPATTGD